MKQGQAGRLLQGEAEADEEATRLADLSPAAFTETRERCA